MDEGLLPMFGEITQGVRKNVSNSLPNNPTWGRPKEPGPFFFLNQGQTKPIPPPPKTSKAKTKQTYQRAEIKDLD